MENVTPNSKVLLENNNIKIVRCFHSNLSIQFECYETKNKLVLVLHWTDET